MEIRYFQIIIPIVSLFFIYSQFRDLANGRSRINETIIVSILWIGIGFLALFPDFFSYIIADIFGVKDNINAVIFFAIGLLFYFQIKLYKLMRKQDQLLTELTRKIALKEKSSIH